MHGREVREAALGLVRSGLSASDAARRVGASESCVGYWCGAAGVRLAPGRTGGPEVRLAEPAQAAEPPARRSPRARPGLERGAPVADRRRAGRGAGEVAREPGVPHSTVPRELRRNARPDGRHGAGFAQRTRYRKMVQWPCKPAGFRTRLFFGCVQHLLCADPSGIKDVPHKWPKPRNPRCLPGLCGTPLILSRASP